MIDNIEPAAFAVTMGAIALACLILAIIDQRRIRREDRDRSEAGERITALIYQGGCARIWREHHRTHVCTRPYEHEGPHVDRVHEALLR